MLHGHDNPVHRVAIDPTAKRVVSAGNDSTIRIWNARTHLEEWTLAGHAGSVHSGTFDPTGRVVVSAGADMTLRIWNTEDGTLLHFWKAYTGTIRDLVFFADGDRLGQLGPDDQSVASKQSGRNESA